MELMGEWDALSAELVDVRAAKATGGDLALASEAAVVAKVQALEKRINTFLGKAARQRQPINGPLVMGTLVSPTDKQSAARHHASPDDAPSREETD